MTKKIEVHSFLVAQHLGENEQLRQIEEAISKMSGRVVSVTENHGTTYCRVRVYLEVDVDDSVEKVKKIIAEADAKYFAEKSNKVKDQ